MRNRLWICSLIVIGTATVLLTVLPALGVALPDIAVRILGVADLIALPVLICTTVLGLKKK